MKHPKLLICKIYQKLIFITKNNTLNNKGDISFKKKAAPKRHGQFYDEWLII